MSKFLIGAAALAMLAGVSAANAQGTASPSELNNMKAPPATQNNTTTGSMKKDSGVTTGMQNSKEAPPQGTAQTPNGATNNPRPGVVDDSTQGGAGTGK